MQIDPKTITPATETEFTAAAPEKIPALPLTEEEKIDLAADRILTRFRAAFEELAK